MTTKSFYYSYIYSQAGGGYFEKNLCAVNVEEIKSWLIDALVEDPYISFFYGIFASVIKVENGVLVANHEEFLANITIEVEGLDGVIFRYQADETEFEYPDEISDFPPFVPAEGVFYADLNSEQTLYLQGLAELEEGSKKPKIIVNVDWVSLGLTELAGDLLQPSEVLSSDEVWNFGIDHPIKLGAND